MAMSDLRTLKDEVSRARGRPPIDRGREPPDDGDMNERLTALESRIDTILPTLATKADIAEVRTEIAESAANIIKWIVGTALGISVAAITIMTFVLNNATPKQAPQQPTVIVVPAAK